MHSELILSCTPVCINRHFTGFILDILKSLNRQGSFSTYHMRKQIFLLLTNTMTYDKIIKIICVLEYKGNERWTCDPRMKTIGMTRNKSSFVYDRHIWSFQKSLAKLEGFVFDRMRSGGGAFWFHKTFIFYDSIVWPSNQGRVICRDSRCDNSSVTHDQDASTVPLRGHNF